MCAEHLNISFLYLIRKYENLFLLSITIWESESPIVGLRGKYTGAVKIGLSSSCWCTRGSLPCHSDTRTNSQTN